MQQEATYRSGNPGASFSADIPADAGRSSRTDTTAGATVLQQTGTTAQQGGDSLQATPSPADSLAADSLAAHTADSLAAWPYDRYGTADSLPAEQQAVIWRDTTAEAVFGRESVLVPPRPLPQAVGQSLTDNAVFQGFVLLLAGTYATLLYRNIGDIRTLLGHVSRERAGGVRLSEDPGSSGFTRFLNLATAIGMLFLGIIAVKYGDSIMPPALSEALAHGAVLALSLIATLACAAIAALQRGFLQLVGAVTASQPFVSQLGLLRRTYFVLGIIVTSPALLLFALCPRGSGDVWFCVIAIELAITVILYLRETLHLFISKKISILHWILYLCAVEIFPISLVWLLVAR